MNLHSIELHFVVLMGLNYIFIIFNKGGGGETHSEHSSAISELQGHWINP